MIPNSKSLLFEYQVQRQSLLFEVPNIFEERIAKRFASILNRLEIIRRSSFQPLPASEAYVSVLKSLYFTQALAYTPMDLESALREERSKAQCNKIVAYIGSDKKKFAELMKIFFEGEYRVTQRAAWPMSYCVRKHPELITPYFQKVNR